MAIMNSKIDCLYVYYYPNLTEVNKMGIEMR